MIKYYVTMQAIEGNETFGDIITKEFDNSIDMRYFLEDDDWQGDYVIREIGYRIVHK